MKRLIIIFFIIFMSLGGTAGSISKGDVNSIVIFVRFADQTPFKQRPRLWYNRFNYYLNPTYISLKNYFRKLSYDSLDVNYYLRPNPFSDSSRMNNYTDPHILNYYVGAINGNDSGYSIDEDLQEWVGRERTLVQNAVIDILPELPTNVDFDVDNDGLVDQVLIITRGPDTSRVLHGHSASLPDTYPVYINGARVSAYSLQVEDYFLDQTAPQPDTTVKNISVIVHESIHIFGGRDLYHDSNHGGVDSLKPVWSFSPMGETTNPPQHNTMYEKWKHNDWIDFVPVLEDGFNVLYPVTTRQDIVHDINTGYRYNFNNPSGEYFMFELRNNTDIWDNTLPDGGLLVYRVNPALYSNVPGPPDEIYVYRVNGNLTTNGSIYNSTFSIDHNRPAFNISTNPQPWLSDGSFASLFIADVGPVGDSIDFFFAHDYNMIYGSTVGIWKSTDPSYDYAYWVFLNSYVEPGNSLYIWNGSHVYMEPEKYLRGDGLVHHIAGTNWTRISAINRYHTGMKVKGEMNLTNGGQIKLH